MNEEDEKKEESYNFPLLPQFNLNILYNYSYKDNTLLCQSQAFPFYFKKTIGLLVFRLFPQPGYLFGPQRFVYCFEYQRHIVKAWIAH